MFQSNNRVIHILYTFLIAIAGGFLFSLLHIPVPWLLGPMVFIMLINNLTKYTLDWNSRLRNIGLFIVGYTLGITMTNETIKVVFQQLPYMLLMTIVLMIFCFIIALTLAKISNIDYDSAFLASVPGGLSQVLVLAEETKGVNITIVTVTQVIRVMMVVSVMPFLVLLPLFQNNEAETSVTTAVSTTTSHFSFVSLFVFLFVSIGVTYVFIKIKFPVAYLLGPMFATAILQIFWTMGPEVPIQLTDLAQLLIGVHVGKMLQFSALPNKSKVLLFAITNGAILIFFAFLLSNVLSLLQPLDHATTLLSLAPGGADQMGVIAHAIHTDLSIVSSYQIFRLFLINFAVSPFIAWLYNLRKTKV